jgi:hypothetical protein
LRFEMERERREKELGEIFLGRNGCYVVNARFHFFFPNEG